MLQTTRYEDISAKHWATLLVLYVFANFIRAVMVAMCYPALRRCGYGVTPEQAAFMVWGGLRGAVGLALALFAKQDLVQFCSCAPKEAACMPDPHLVPFGKPRQNLHLLVFFAGGLALLTLVINGTLAGSVLRYLELTKVPAARRVMRAQAQKLIAEHTKENKGKFKSMRKFHLAHPQLGPRVERRVMELVASLRFGLTTRFERAQQQTRSERNVMKAWSPDSGRPKDPKNAPGLSLWQAQRARLPIVHVFLEVMHLPQPPVLLPHAYSPRARIC